MHRSQGHSCSCENSKHMTCHDGIRQSAALIPISVFLKVTGNVLAGEALRTAAHSLQNLAGNSFVDTQSLHSTHKLIMQLTCPLNLQHTTCGSSSLGNQDSYGASCCCANMFTDCGSLAELVGAVLGSDWYTTSRSCHK